MTDGSPPDTEGDPPSSAEPGRHAPSSSDRLVSLDVLRAAAVLLVLGRHLPAGLEPSSSEWLNGVLAVWHRGGWVGVDLFFVLSGFLVSGLLFREQQRHGEISLKRFFIRRGFRIYPPFYTLLLVTLILSSWRAAKLVVWGDLTFETRSVLGEVFYLQNYLGGIWGHTWTLAVEEHFYVCLPLLLLLLLKLGRGSIRLRGVLGAYGMTAFACLAQRLALTRVPYDGTHLTPTHLRLDSLLCGVVLSYLYHYRSRWLAPWLISTRRSALLAVVGVGCVAPAFVLTLEETPFIPSLGLTLFQLGFAALLLVSLRFKPRGRVWRGVAFVGTHSYSIYLWHFPVRHFAAAGARELPGYLSSGSWYLLYLIASLAVGVAMAKLVELPLLRLRDRLFPRRERELQAAGG